MLAAVSQRWPYAEGHELAAIYNSYGLITYLEGSRQIGKVPGQFTSVVRVWIWVFVE